MRCVALEPGREQEADAPARPIEWCLTANELAGLEIGGMALEDERRHRVSGVAGEYLH